MQENTSAKAAASVSRLSFDTASIWVLAVTGLLAAVAFIPAATIPFLYTKVSILAVGGLIALMLYILARLTRGNVIVPPVTLIGAMWLVPLAYLLSSLFSQAGLQTSFFGAQMEGDTLGFMLVLAILGTLVALAYRRVEHYKIFFKVAAIGYALVVLSQVVMVIIAKTSPGVVTGATNIVGSFTDLGMITGLGIAVSLIAVRFLTLSKKIKQGIYGAIGLGLLVLAIVNSTLIWSMVALVALGLFIEAIMNRRTSVDDSDFEGVATIEAEAGEHEKRGQGERALVVALVTLLASVFFIMSSGTIGNALSAAANANFIDVRPSWQSTFDVGSHTYASSPILGTGPSTFGTQWLKFRDRALNETVFWNLDFTTGIGLIPTSFVTTGILGALAWVGMIGLFLWVGLRSLLFRAPRDQFIRFASIASFTGALYVLALAVITVPGPAVLAAGFLMLGIFVSTLRHGKERHEWGVIFSRNQRVGFVVVFGLTLLLFAALYASFIVVSRYLSEVAYVEGLQAVNQGQLDVAETAAGRAISFSPSDRAYQLLATVGTVRMREIANDTTLAPSEAQQRFQTVLSGTIDSAITATRLGPNNYTNWMLLGNVYQAVVPLKIDGAYENAKTAFTRAQELNPSSPMIPYTLAQLEIAQSKPAEAEAYLMQAISLKRDYTQAIFLLSQLQVAQGKSREALQAAEAAAYFAPNDPVVLFQLGILRSGTGDTQGAIAALSRAVDLKKDYANARFFLAVAYATGGNLPEAYKQLQAVAELSPQNAQAVAADMAALAAGKNPYPASRLGALGIPQVPVSDTTTPAAAPQGR